MAKTAWRNKRKRIRQRDGDDCWLCKKPIDFTLENDHAMRASLDHYVPRKWGGSNRAENLRLAHQHCNVSREHYRPETMEFTDEEIYLLTNPSHVKGELSRAARKAKRKKNGSDAFPHDVSKGLRCSTTF
jgi:HNH endonuclease